MARPNVSVYINDDSFVIPGSFTGTSRGGLISYGGLVLALGTTAERKSGIMQIGTVADWIQRLTTTDPIAGTDGADGKNHVTNTGTHATAGTTGAGRWPYGPTGGWRGEWWAGHNFLQYGGELVVGGTGSETHTGTALNSGRETLKDTSIPLDFVFVGGGTGGSSNDTFTATRGGEAPNTGDSTASLGSVTELADVANVVTNRRDCIGVFPAVTTGHSSVAASPGLPSGVAASEYQVVVWGDKKHLGISRTGEILGDSSLLSFHLAPDVAGCMARTDELNDPWWSPAGFTRGRIQDVVRLVHNPTDAEQDRLYNAKLNPVVTFPGEGTVLFGDKTTAIATSTLSRINVSRLFIYLKKTIGAAARNYLFEINNADARSSFKNAVEPFLSTIKSRRGIIDYRVVCDETNNTGAVIDSNQFVADVFIKPAKSINFIKLTFTNKNTADTLN